MYHVQLSQEEVDNPSTIDYPPRIIFDVISSKDAIPSAFQLFVTGLTKHSDFQISLTLVKTLGG